MKRNPVLHPFLFAVFPVLFLYSHNIAEVSFTDALPMVAAALVAAAAFFFAARYFFRDGYRAGIFVLSVIVLFYSYGRFYDFAQGVQIGKFVLGRNRHLLAAWFIVFVCGFFFVYRTKTRNYGTLNHVLNIVAVCLVCVSLANIGIYKLGARNVQAAGNDVSGKETAEENAAAISRLRDIYYIILDGYAGQRTLRDIYGFDNGEFLNRLKEKGFFIAEKSRSNYVQTFLSLASSLNMEYINGIAGKIGPDSADRNRFYQMIKDNKVRKTLKAKGYKFVHFGSGWGATNYNKLADINFYEGANEFLSVFIQTTLLLPFEKYLIGDNARQRIINTFSGIEEISGRGGPKFVFAHIIAPHPPFLFGRNGEPAGDAKLDMDGYVWNQKDKYIDQLIYVNDKVGRLIDGIISRSAVSPIIILQADHGSASTFGHPDDGGWENPTGRMIGERTDIFNAYYLPDGGNAKLYDEISPVNTFRLVLSHYFQEKYDVLEDRSYFSSYDHPYKFIKVGNR